MSENGSKYVKSTATILIICGSLFTSPEPAHAYLDPGTGSMILQLILGGAAGVAVILKLFWNRLLTFFGTRKNKNTQIEVERVSPNAEPEAGEGFGGED